MTFICFTGRNGRVNLNDTMILINNIMRLILAPLVYILPPYRINTVLKSTELFSDRQDDRIVSILDSRLVYRYQTEREAKAQAVYLDFVR
jgi:hypothetical protein